MNPTKTYCADQLKNSNIKTCQNHTGIPLIFLSKVSNVLNISLLFFLQIKTCSIGDGFDFTAYMCSLMIPVCILLREVNELHSYTQSVSVRLFVALKSGI